MSGVLEFKRPDQDGPYVAGNAICAYCKHEWLATSPVGTKELQCPSCSTHRGAFRYQFGPDTGDLSYSCDCGGEDFYIMKKQGQANAAVNCRGCGKEATGWLQ